MKTLFVSVRGGAVGPRPKSNGSVLLFARIDISASRVIMAVLQAHPGKTGDGQEHTLHNYRMASGGNVDLVVVCTACITDESKHLKYPNSFTAGHCAQGSRNGALRILFVNMTFAVVFHSGIYISRLRYYTIFYYHREYGRLYTNVCHQCAYCIDKFVDVYSEFLLILPLTSPFQFGNRPGGQRG